jgi:hypothetical protein
MTGPDKQALWEERLGAWKASGESMRAFAQRHGWAPRQLAWWKNRLMDKPALTPGLIPVAVKTAGATNPIRLAGPNWTLELPGAIPAGWLAELLRSL